MQFKPESFAVVLGVLLLSCCGPPPPPPPPPPSPCVPPSRRVLDLTNVPQERNYTCWAGVTRTIGKYMERPETECALVRRRKSDCTCPSCPDSMEVPEGPCNNGGWPPFEAIGLKAKRTTNEAIPLETLKSEIACHNRPVAFTWNFGGGSGHIMVAFGYDGENIHVANPAPPCAGRSEKIIPYEFYRDGEDGEGAGVNHWDDFYGFEVIQ